MKKILLLIILLVSLVNNSNAQQHITIKQDTLIFNYRVKADSVKLVLLGPAPFPMKRIADTKTWKLKIPHESIDKLMLSYTFLEYHNKNLQPNYSDWFFFSGSKAAPLPLKVDFLKGRLIPEHIFSNKMQQQRKITVYLPPNYDEKRSEKYPVVYLADDPVSDYAYYVENLIQTRQIPPVILVGIHYGERPYVFDENYPSTRMPRSLEYLKFVEETVESPYKEKVRAIFDNHYNFFCHEVNDYIESKYLASSNKKDKLIFGGSNGGAFALSVGAREPDLYGYVISSSPAGSFRNRKLRLFGDKHPFYFISYGKFEDKAYRLNAEAWKKQLDVQKQDYVYEELNSYHDGIAWRSFFIKSILEIFK